jgi:hypothetical protein
MLAPVGASMVTPLAIVISPIASFDPLLHLRGGVRLGLCQHGRAVQCRDAPGCDERRDDSQ